MMNRWLGSLDLNPGLYNPLPHQKWHGRRGGRKWESCVWKRRSQGLQVKENRYHLPEALTGSIRTTNRIQIQPANPNPAVCHVLGYQEQKHHLRPLVAHSWGNQTDTGLVIHTQAPHHHHPVLSAWADPGVKKWGPIARNWTYWWTLGVDDGIYKGFREQVEPWQAESQREAIPKSDDTEAGDLKECWGRVISQ